MQKILLILFLFLSSTIEIVGSTHYVAQSHSDLPYDIVPFHPSMKNDLCLMIEGDMDMKMKLHATNVKNSYFSTDTSKKEKILVCSMKEENHNPSIGPHCGFIKYNLRSAGKSSSGDGCINGLAVHAAYRRQGIAQSLLHACEDDYKKNSDLRQLQLHVFSTNDDAVQLYQKYGFNIDSDDYISTKMVKSL